jgi:DNA invertase Pin-like site-specific DNA recombinase
MDCLDNIRTLEDHGIRFIAVTQGWILTSNPASKFLLPVLATAAFERSLIRERTQQRFTTDPARTCR